MGPTSITAEFVELIASLCVVYQREADELLYLAYWEVLEDQPIEDLQEAVMLCKRQDRWFPVPATILEQCRAIRQSRRPYYRASIEQGTTPEQDARFRERLNQVRQEVAERANRNAHDMQTGERAGSPEG